MPDSLVPFEVKVVVIIVTETPSLLFNTELFADPDISKFIESAFANEAYNLPLYSETGYAH
ncbi:MAG: hypothetical protein QW597_04805 [Thermoplasmataceae archaeon]